MKLNLWLSPSAKQCQNCFVDPYMRFRTWVRTMIGLLKGSLLISQSGWKEIQNGFLVILWVRLGPSTRTSALVADVTNRGKVPSATQAETTASLVPGVCLLWQETWELSVKETTLHLCLPWHQFHITVSNTMWSVMQDCKVWNSPQASSLGGGYEGKLFFSLTPRAPRHLSCRLSVEHVAKIY